MLAQAAHEQEMAKLKAALEARMAQMQTECEARLRAMRGKVRFAEGAALGAQASRNAAARALGRVLCQMGVPPEPVQGDVVSPYFGSPRGPRGAAEAGDGGGGGGCRSPRFSPPPSDVPGRVITYANLEGP
jgi:hypothetical protein